MSDKLLTFSRHKKENMKYGNSGTGQLARETPGARHANQSEISPARYYISRGILACVRISPTAVLSNSLVRVMRKLGVCI
jgi:hypothetical protein